ncbi:hypothetical protein NDU88_006481 [Pleurodeles waltl]|uniref:Uncharacterized protein n=1 Tax=Pleurodeles waltl TaxID=8319 RepID=A0AAV7NS26_PLEWA|nr:hypothetical protein NDU88_006481 [Pleurodeles waltl]
MEPNKVVEALRVLQQEGREDLIKEGVLEQAWVGLKRPKRSSAEGVSSAIIACASPAGSPKKYRKFKTKSFSGRKVSMSPERAVQDKNKVRENLPGSRYGRRGGIKVPRRSGSSLRQSVAALGRGSLQMAAVSSFGQVVVQDARSRAAQVPARRHEEKLEIGARAARRRRAGKSWAQHAQLALESEGSAQFLAKERTLGGAANMAAPSGFSSNADFNEESQPGVSREVGVDQIYEDVIIVLDSDDDERGLMNYMAKGAVRICRCLRV